MPCLWKLVWIWTILHLFVKTSEVCATLFAPSLHCDFYTKSDCEDRDPPDERCSNGTNCNEVPGHTPQCMAEWANGSQGIEVTRKGCWADDQKCSGKDECFEDYTNPGTYFCCCESNNCNSQISYRPSKPAPAEDDHDVICEYYDPIECPEDAEAEQCSLPTERCDPPQTGKHTHCYATWQNISSQLKIIKKGCWSNHEMCLLESCIQEGDVSNNLFFCCCTGSMCNVDMEHRVVSGSPETTLEITDMPTDGEERKDLLITILYSIVPIGALAVIIAFSFWLYRRHKTPHILLPTVDPSPIPPPSPVVGFRSIQLHEIKARGRFGHVWKALMVDDIVAVKIFPIQDSQSYQTEKDIYQLPYFSSHENILNFICGEKHLDHSNQTMEFWLVTEYHEKGSLYDFLKGNLITWAEMIKLAHSMAKGLSFLHEEIPGGRAQGFKPSVVHRDFKSKNVLIRDDMTVCIADMGLALIFEPCKPIGDTHGQVGTRRYMAPEVLEGAINFSRDHFLRIDMYACGLVLWELLSRCTVNIDGPMEEYQLPFEEEVGLHPSLEDMQEYVVQRKMRPVIKESWLSHPGMYALSQTCCECWDTDPEARLSSGCVQERIIQLLPTVQYSTTSPGGLLPTSNGIQIDCTCPLTTPTPLPPQAPLPKDLSVA